jgi:hypothetical protein
MHQEGLIVIDQELIELDSVIRMKGRDSISISRDLSHFALHVKPPLPAPALEELIRAQTGPMHASMKQLLRNELETELRRVVGVWFPRSVDREHGGFLCDFNHRWKASGPQHKMLEYQARQTTTSAQAAIHFPNLAFLRESTDNFGAAFGQQLF